MIRDYPDRIPQSALHPRRRPWKAYLGDACIVAAIVMFVWSMIPG